MQIPSRSWPAIFMAFVSIAVAAWPDSIPPARAQDPPGPAAATAAAAQAAPKADLVLRNGAIYTVDRVRSWAEAVAIRGDKILYVGANKGVAKHIGPKTRVVDLAGKMVLPGFQDAHVHPLSGGLGQISCALYDLPNREAYLKAVADYAAKNPRGAWIRGDGWDMSHFPKGIPDRADLDAVVPDRPVYLDSKDGHTAWVNTKALQMAGITRDTPDPANGRIDRDPTTGEAVGSLQESAMELVRRHLPPYTEEEARRGLRLALRMLNGYGITSVQDAAVGLGAESGYRPLDVYRSLDARGELTARVVTSLLWEHDKGEAQIPALIRARREYTRGRIRAGTVKIFQDGVIESKTAALLRPYRKGGGSGMALEEPESLKRIVSRLDKEGFQVHFHAIGDAAIRHCLDAVEAARTRNGARDARHHLSHIELFHPDDIPRFRQLGVVANFQPLWARADSYITDLTLPILESQTHRWLYPIGSVLRSGAVVAFGSDWSVSSANPLDEIEVAVTRTGWSGDEQDLEPFLPEERIDLRDAIAAFTINAAYVNFQEDRTGSIEAGKLADLIVLDRNLFAIEPRQISESRVLLTLLGGKPVHGDPGTLAGGAGAR
jgi:hypothetical protein